MTTSIYTRRQAPITYTYFSLTVIKYTFKLYLLKNTIKRKEHM